MEHSFPGLAAECMQCIKDLRLPDITSEKVDQNRWKIIVKSAIKYLNEQDLKADLQRNKKGEEFSLFTKLLLAVKEKQKCHLENWRP